MPLLPPVINATAFLRFILIPPQLQTVASCHTCKPGVTSSDKKSGPESFAHQVAIGQTSSLRILSRDSVRELAWRNPND